MAKYTVRFYGSEEFMNLERDLNAAQPSVIESIVWSPADRKDERSGVLVVLRWDSESDVPVDVIDPAVD